MANPVGVLTLRRISGDTFEFSGCVLPDATVTAIGAGDHASRHKSGGADGIKLDELGTPTDVTTLNATTSVHGLLPKLGGGTTNFLRADGTWNAAGSSSPASTVTDESSFGLPSIVGSLTAYAREDHQHGSPAAPASSNFIARAKWDDF